MAGADGAAVEPDALFARLAAHRLHAQKKSWRYQERDEHQRATFLKQLEPIPPEDRVYVDEAGVDDTHSYAYGWSPKGKRCYAERLGHRTQRISMVAAWCQGEVVAPLTFEGYCDSALVEAWFQTQLCPALRPGQVVMLDNASFHHHGRLRHLLASVGCTLLALPAYSPDLNQIEPLWHVLKSRIAHSAHQHATFREAVDAVFL